MLMKNTKMLNLNIKNKKNIICLFVFNGFVSTFCLVLGGLAVELLFKYLPNHRNSNYQTTGIRTTRPWEFELPDHGNSNYQTTGIRETPIEIKEMTQTTRPWEFELPDYGNSNYQTMGIRTTRPWEFTSIADAQ